MKFISLKRYSDKFLISLSKNYLHIILIVALFIMGIGYSAIGVVTDLNANGIIQVEGQTGIIITDVVYKNNINANLSESKIVSFHNNFLNSCINLSKTDNNSSITYQITILNSEKDTYFFDNVLYSEDAYDNENISFELSGLKEGDILKGEGVITFDITFHYKNGILADNNILQSYLKFNFIKSVYLNTIPNSEYSDELWAYKKTITKIVFENKVTEFDNSIATFDISENNDGSIISTILLNDDGVTHTAYIQSNYLMFAPEKSEYLFSNFIKLNSIENIELLDTSYVRRMNNMFYDCKELSYLDLSSFNTSNVINMSSMFYGMTKLFSLDISKFNTSKVTAMNNMFYGCQELTSLDLSHFDTSSTTRMDSMFSNMKKLTSLNISNFKTDRVTKMNSMFTECNSLTFLDLSHFNTSNVTDMNNMFSHMNKITSLNVSSFDTSNVTEIHHMFWDCKSLTSIDVSNFRTSKIRVMDMMFANMDNLKSLDLSSFDTSLVRSFNAFVYGNRNLTSLNIESFDTSNVDWAQSMFLDCSSLTSLDVSNFDTRKITRFNSMFGGCSSLTDLDLSSFDTISADEMQNMFYGCKNLKNITFGDKFNTSNVTTLEGMFYNCSSLTSLDLSTFRTSNVKSMDNMFNNCSSLTELDLSTFDMTGTSYNGMLLSTFNIKNAYARTEADAEILNGIPKPPVYTFIIKN